MPYTSEFLTTSRGPRLHYLRWLSDGPPVVIVHGNSHCGGVYAPLGERLSSDFQVVAVDLMCHGLSDKPDDAGHYSWQGLRGDVLELVDSLGLRDILLVGHSRGGGVSLLTAAAIAERVRGAVVYEPTVTLQMAQASPQALHERAARMAEGARRRRATFADRHDMYRHFHGRGAFKDWREEYLKAYVEHGAVDSPGGGLELACPARVEAALFEAMVHPEEWQKIHDCPVPVLALFGDRGGRVGPGIDHTSVLRRLFPRTQAHILPDCSHSGPMEHPELFEAAIREFAATAPD